MALVVGLAGCGGGSNDQIIAASPSQEGSAVAIEYTKPAGVSELTAPNGDLVIFQENAFPAATEVKLAVTSSTVVDEVFEQTGEFYDARRTRAEALKVTVQDLQPASDVKVKLSIQDSDRTGARNDDEFRVMYVNVYDDGSKRLESVEATSIRVPKDANEIEAEIPREAFFPNENGKFVAYVFLGRTPTAPDTAAPLSPLAALKARWRAMEIVPRAYAADEDECAGNTLLRPVGDQFPVTSRYGPRGAPVAGASTYHRGVDYGTPVGTPVKAAADGTLHIRKEVNKKTGAYKGYGYHVYVKQADGSVTLYAHLSDGSAMFKEGESVKAGDVIASTGNTGIGSGPHLHFEYIPSGKVYEKSEKVDPAPCLEKLAKGQISIRDNGNVADDAFTVYLNDVKICSTTIGAANSCSFGKLRKGQYALKLVADIAPDNVGTYEMGVAADSTVSIDGKDKVSGTIGQGAAAVFTLVVP